MYDYKYDEERKALTIETSLYFERDIIKFYEKIGKEVGKALDDFKKEYDEQPEYINLEVYVDPIFLKPYKGAIKTVFLALDKIDGWLSSAVDMYYLSHKIKRKDDEDFFDKLYDLFFPYRAKPEKAAKIYKFYSGISLVFTSMELVSIPYFYQLSDYKRMLLSVIAALIWGYLTKADFDKYKTCMEKIEVAKQREQEKREILGMIDNAIINVNVYSHDYHEDIKLVDIGKETSRLFLNEWKWE